MGSIFAVVYSLYILYKMLVSLCVTGVSGGSWWSNFVGGYVYAWVYAVWGEVESAEEVVCLFILWP